MNTRSVSEMILEHIKQSGLTATTIFKNAGIERFHGYDIINGSKKPERNEMIRLAIVLGMSPDTTQEILNLSGYPGLDPEDGRDSAILFALRQGGDVDGLNETLSDLGYEKIP